MFLLCLLTVSCFVFYCYLLTSFLILVLWGHCVLIHSTSPPLILVSNWEFTTKTYFHNLLISKGFPFVFTLASYYHGYKNLPSPETPLPLRHYYIYCHVLQISFRYFSYLRIVSVMFLSEYPKVLSLDLCHFFPLAGSSSFYLILLQLRYHDQCVQLIIRQNPQNAHLIGLPADTHRHTHSHTPSLPKASNCLSGDYDLYLYEVKKNISRAMES